MSKKYYAKDWEERILDAISKTNNMTEAYKMLNLERKTFKRMAEELGVYNPNQGNKGSSKPKSYHINTEDILSNKVSYPQTHKLKLRLIKEGFFEKKCMRCNNTKLLGNNIPLELHHKDGKRENNSLSNLELLCPNCHALTDTYRSKNLKNN